MTLNNNLPFARGIVRLDFRDVETLEIKRTVEHKNAITYAGTHTIMAANDTGHLNLASNAQPTGEWIYITDRITTDGLVTAHKSIIAARSPTHLTRGSINQQEWTYFSGNPDFAEKVVRFLAPGSDLTINTIYVSSDNTLAAFAIASLSTPCIQTTSEVLDVTYRIQWFFQAQDPAGLLVSPSFGEAVARKTTNQTPEPDGGFPNALHLMWSAAPTITEYFGLQGEVQAAPVGSSVIIRRRFFRNEYSLNETITSNIGRVIRSIGYGDFSNSFFGSTDLFRTTAWAPIAPDSFVNKPIQTIHNHEASAIEWGLDVDFLTTGQGSLTLDGSSWTDPDWPQFYRIDHTVTGQTGVSRYAWKKRPTTGFEGNTYESSRKGNVLLNHQESIITATADYATITGLHGGQTYYQMEEIDQESIGSWDSSGITVNNLNDNHSINFDSTTTPALTGTDIRQIATDSAGNIWVAAGTGGLFKIVDAFGSPTVTKMTVATNTLPGGGEDNCYAVAIGNGGDVLALVEGGLIRSTNPTAGTPLFVAETFSFTGISDANWDKVLYLRVDRDSTDYELALVTELNLPTLNHSVVWWSTAQVAILGPTSSTYTINGTTRKSKYGRINVSQRGSLWCRHGPLQENDHTQLIVFGTTTAVDMTSFGGGYDIPIFFYDYYDTPHFGGGVSGSFGIWAPGDTRADDKFHGGHDGHAFASSWQSFHGSRLAFETVGGQGLFLSTMTNTDTQGENNPGAQSVRTMSPKANQYLDPLNGQYSPMEESLWRRYGYNGAAWVENYFADAADTGTHAGGPYDADRHNFDPEIHDFTGRSMIDVTAAFPASAYASSAIGTFVFTLDPVAKLSNASNDIASAQEKPRILLDISDSVQQFQIVWDDDIQGNITIVEDGDGGTVIASTPANGSTYRLVVVVSGTAVTVYLDGNTTPIGSLTLANAYDWDNTGGDPLIAFLGCGVYKWSHLQRNTPWQNNFYRGELKNVQFWNVAWDTTDVSNDFGDITAVIGSKPAGNLVARYELTQSLATLETKLSHVGAEALDEGITIAFANGVAPTAFIADDYHTFGVVDGILKDNAIAFTQNFSIYFKPTDTSFSDFDNGQTASTISASTTAIVDEKAIFAFEDIRDPVIDPIFNSFLSDLKMKTAPGQIFQNQSVSPSDVSVYGGITVQPITGNGYFEGSPSHGNDRVTFGLTDSPGNNHSSALIDFGIRFNDNGDVDIVELNVVVSAAIGTYVTGDVFRITRTGTAITYQKNGGLIFTSGTTSSGTVYGRVHPTEEGYGLTDCKITYTRPGHILTVGDPVGVTGFFDPEFIIVETGTVESISINIAGSPATVVISETYYDNMTAPGPGEVVVNGDMGWLLFNAADVGSAITGDVTVVFEKV